MHYMSCIRRYNALMNKVIWISGVTVKSSRAHPDPANAYWFIHQCIISACECTSRMHYPIRNLTQNSYQTAGLVSLKSYQPWTCHTLLPKKCMGIRSVIFRGGEGECKILPKKKRGKRKEKNTQKMKYHYIIRSKLVMDNPAAGRSFTQTFRTGKK